MKDKARAAVLAAFAADSLALGVHWIYNTNVIDRKVGRVETLLKPIVTSWHPNRGQGEFTHYGDQALVLLASAAACGRFDRDDFFARWQALFAGYDGYVDKATRATLDNIAQGRGPGESGSASDDLGGASRMAPLVFLYRGDPEKMAAAARAQTAMTHNHPAVVAGAECIARAVCRVLQGAAPAAALGEAAAEGGKESPVARWVSEGLASAAADTRQAILDFGQMCEIDAAFPAAVHLVARYEGNLKEALVQNVMAGGDSASRGMVVGMLLGAHLGMGAVPAQWVSGLKRGEDIARCLEALDRAGAGRGKG